jgi:hypothetical protein
MFKRDPEKKRIYERQYKILHRDRIRELARNWRAKHRGRILLEEAERRSRLRIQYLVTSAKHRAKRRGVDFDLSYTDLSIPDSCPLCSGPIVYSTGRPTKQSPSIDRIVPSIGYVARNAWVICAGCNQAKSSVTPKMLFALLAEMRRRGLIEEEQVA